MLCFEFVSQVVNIEPAQVHVTVASVTTTVVLANRAAAARWKLIPFIGHMADGATPEAFGSCQVYVLSTYNIASYMYLDRNPVLFRI
jgi:hypothetical protein